MTATECVDAAPKKPDKEKQRDRIDLRCEPEFRERIESQAERFGIGLSAYIRQAVTEKLERDERTDPSLQNEPKP